MMLTAAAYAEVEAEMSGLTVILYDRVGDRFVKVPLALVLVHEARHNFVFDRYEDLQHPERVPELDSFVGCEFSGIPSSATSPVASPRGRTQTEES